MPLEFKNLTLSAKQIFYRPLPMGHPTNLSVPRLHTNMLLLQWCQGCTFCMRIFLALSRPTLSVTLITRRAQAGLYVRTSYRKMPCWSSVRAVPFKRTCLWRVFTYSRLLIALRAGILPSSVMSCNVLYCTAMWYDVVYCKVKWSNVKWCRVTQCSVM